MVIGFQVRGFSKSLVMKFKISLFNRLLRLFGLGMMSILVDTLIHSYVCNIFTFQAKVRDLKICGEASQSSGER